MISLIYFGSSKFALVNSHLEAHRMSFCSPSRYVYMFWMQSCEMFHPLSLNSKNLIIDFGVKTSNAFTLEITAGSMHFTLDWNNIRNNENFNNAAFIITKRVFALAASKLNWWVATLTSHVATLIHSNCFFQNIFKCFHLHFLIFPLLMYNSKAFYRKLMLKLFWEVQR